MLQLIEIATLSDRHFWHEGYDKADLGLPFASWTLDRLVAYLGEKGIGMKRSRMSEVLLAKGLKWRQEETWFGTRVDPEFERKRGCSSASTPLHPRAA